MKRHRPIRRFLVDRVDERRGFRDLPKLRAMAEAERQRDIAKGYICTELEDLSTPQLFCFEWNAQ